MITVLIKKFPCVCCADEYIYELVVSTQILWAQNICDISVEKYLPFPTS